MTLIALIASAALQLPVPPVSTNLVSETSVTIPFAPNRAGLRSLDFVLALNASPSNNLEIAIGEDADGNGRLDLLEADLTFGYDCGKWIWMETENGSRVTIPAPTEGRAENTWTFREPEIPSNWNALRVTRRGTALTAELALLNENHPGFLLLFK